MKKRSQCAKQLGDLIKVTNARKSTYSNSTSDGPLCSLVFGPLGRERCSLRKPMSSSVLVPRDTLHKNPK